MSDILKAEQFLNDLSDNDFKMNGVDGVHHWGADDFFGYSVYLGFEIEDVEDERGLITLLNSMGTVHAAQPDAYFTEVNRDFDEVGPVVVLRIIRPSREEDVSKFLKQPLANNARRQSKKF